MRTTQFAMNQANNRLISRTNKTFFFFYNLKWPENRSKMHFMRIESVFLSVFRWDFNDQISFDLFSPFLTIFFIDATIMNKKKLKQNQFILSIEQLRAFEMFFSLRRRNFSPMQTIHFLHWIRARITVNRWWCVHLNCNRKKYIFCFKFAFAELYNVWHVPAFYKFSFVL